MRQQPRSVARAVTLFALSGLIVLAVVGVVGFFLLQRIAGDRALREAERITVVAGEGAVEPRLTNGILRGNPSSLVTMDGVVHGGILRDPIVHVKLWDADGQIIYSDVPEQIGERFALDEYERTALTTGKVVATESDPNRPENVFETDLGPLLEVSAPISVPNGTPLLFQAYVPVDAVATSGRELWTTFLPVLAAALLALALLQIPLAYGLARRVEDSRREQERLLQRAIDASELEQRRIAADLHDGLVQELAGLSMSLAARADVVTASDPASAEALREAAHRTRQGVRSLRSAVMGIDPPSLVQAGLGAALSDLTAPLTEYGIESTVEVPPQIELPMQIESLLFRASREALRNVVTHAGASKVRVRITADGGSAKLLVEDNGVGFSADELTAARSNGHLGLKLLADLASDAEGTLRVEPAPGRGTRLELEVPIR